MEVLGMGVTNSVFHSKGQVSVEEIALQMSVRGMARLEACFVTSAGKISPPTRPLSFLKSLNLAET